MSLSYHSKAFIKTVILSFVMIVPTYHFFYAISSSRAKAEILGKMDPHYTSDGLKNHILDYNRRKSSGDVETYEGSELQKELGGEALAFNYGLSAERRKKA